MDWRRSHVNYAVRPNCKRKTIPNEPEENEVTKLSKEQAAFNAQHQGGGKAVWTHANHFPVLGFSLG
eukprot:scaffold7753_cov149-Ochromonas_danica.AAC.2